MVTQRGEKSHYTSDFNCFAVESQAHNDFHLSNVFWIVSVFSLDPVYDSSFKTMKKNHKQTMTCILIHMVIIKARFLHTATLFKLSKELGSREITPKKMT